MARYNALEGVVETPAAPAPKPRPRKPAAKAAAPVGEKGPAPIVKIAARVPQSAAAATVAPLTPAARHAARLPVATYAALLGTTDHAAARQSRDAFTGWLNARPEQADWRAAWSLYAGGKLSVEGTAEAPPLIESSEPTATATPVSQLSTFNSQLPRTRATSILATL